MNIVQKPKHLVVPSGVMVASPQVLTPGSVSASTFLGAAISVNSAATTYNDYIWNPDFPWTGVTSTAIANPANIDSSDFPTITRSGGFTGTEQVALNNGNGKVLYSLNFSNSVGATYRETTGAVVGSYLKYSLDVVQPLLASGNSKAAFLPNGTRNPSSWWPHSQLTGIPYSNTSGGAGRNGALVTARHILCARHLPIHVGDTVRFVTAGNVTESRTVLARSVPSIVEAPFYDLMVVVLSSNLPGSISPLPIVGEWICNTSAGDALSYSTAPQFVGIWLDQNRDAGFVDIPFPSNQTDFHSRETWDGLNLSTFRPTSVPFFSGISGVKLPSLDGYRSNHKTSGVSGDSGSAVLVPVAGGWAVASCMLTGGSGPYPNAQVINKLILAADASAGISTGFTITIAPSPTP